ncbi:UNVERIFIED_CONTAM: hypothetical protein Slati_3816400 [Sesamum latifolium]|uniref:BED-type domain-containing protein n=1 Tax=Sesamum latifolium TaxID=2727402 RepID=A0AAW2U6G7_9LAMI
MPRQKDQIWEHATNEGDRIRCNICQATFKGGITRIKYHLARITCNDVRPCPVVSDELCQIAKKAVEAIATGGKRKNRNFNLVEKGITPTSLHLTQAPSLVEPSSLKQKTLFAMTRKKEKEIADDALVKAMIICNILFNILRSEEFVAACAKIAEHGPGYVPPSSETARTKILA